MVSAPTPALPESIALGLSGLQQLDFVEAGPAMATDGGWEIELVVRTTFDTEMVPAESRWVVALDADYPKGTIRVYPALDGGIEHTFPHQDLNLPADHGRYRFGKLCLDGATSRLSRFGGSPEPDGDADLRLAWHAWRAKQWVDAASTNSLMDPNEPFELPRYPIDTTVRIIHDEGPDTWRHWSSRLRASGKVSWGGFPGIDTAMVATRFSGSNGEVIRESKRGSVVEGGEAIGSWWLWPRPIVLAPWQVPVTWGELRRVGRALRVDVDKELRRLARCYRGNATGAILLLGYPIPKTWNGDPNEVHWQAVIFPPVPPSTVLPKGFRDNEMGRWQPLRRTIFADDVPIIYLQTESWHPDRLSARGRMEGRLTDKSICVIGAGALGASLAEVLVRGGCRRVRIIDGDTLAAGNLVRHPLTADVLGQNKATALAARLRLASPFATIEAVDSCLPTSEQAILDQLGDIDLVCDCTGEDSVIAALSAPRWALPKVFLSTSLGYAARRLFLFSALGSSFPGQQFLADVQPWLDHERRSWAAAGETLEGAGCWSPLFPARSDDIWLAAIAAVKYLERLVREIPSTRAELHVLEQVADGGFGFRFLDSPTSDVP